LAKAFSNVYVQAHRQKDRANHARNDTSCDEATKSDVGIALLPIENTINDATNELQDLMDQLEALEAEKTQLEDATAQLEDRIDKINNRCAAGEETSEYLQGVKDIISVLKMCPGMSILNFTLSTFQGFAEFHQDAYNDTDAVQDQLMETACQRAFPNATRAARHRELYEGLVMGLPSVQEHGKPRSDVNEGPYDLMGTCGPRFNGTVGEVAAAGCAGEPDTNVRAASGHARHCWPPEALITEGNLSAACRLGQRIAACIVEQPPTI